MGRWCIISFAAVVDVDNKGTPHTRHTTRPHLVVLGERQGERDDGSRQQDLDQSVVELLHEELKDRLLVVFGQVCAVRVTEDVVHTVCEPRAVYNKVNPTQPPSNKNIAIKKSGACCCDYTQPPRRVECGVRHRVQPWRAIAFRDMNDD